MAQPVVTKVIEVWATIRSELWNLSAEQTISFGTLKCETALKCYSYPPVCKFGYPKFKGDKYA